MQPVHVNPQVLQIQLGKVFTLLHISFFCNVWTIFATKLLRKRINLLYVEKYFCRNVEFYFVEFEFESAPGHGGSSVVSCVNSELLFLESRQTIRTVKMDKKEKYEQYRARGRV